MSKIVDIEDYRAKNKPTAISAVLMLINEDGFPEFQKEVLAPFKDTKDLEDKMFGILKSFSEDGADLSDIDSATDMTLIAGGPNSKDQRYSFDYTINAPHGIVKATVFFRIYTYGLSKDENAKVYKMLN